MYRSFYVLSVLFLSVSPNLAGTYLFSPAVCSPPADPSCIFGDPAEFKIFGAQLSSPTAGNPHWQLTVETNYMATIPGSGAVVPPAPYLLNGTSYTQGNHGFFSIGDFLINWNGNDYGIDLSPHDSLQVGNLYEVQGFLTAADVMNVPLSGQLIAPTGPVLPYAAHRSDLFVWLGASGTSLGLGTLSGAHTGDGASSALYTLTDVFDAPAGFLGDGKFTVEMSSYVCGNGFIDSPPDAPEPGTIVLLSSVFLLLGVRLARPSN
jgi:hypothetical protein